MRAEVLRTLVNAGHLAPGETRHPTDEIYRLSGDDPLKQLLLEGRSYVGVIDDPELHPVERSLLERLAGARALAVPIMLGDVAWGELWATATASHAGLRRARPAAAQRDRRAGGGGRRARRAVRPPGRARASRTADRPGEPRALHERLELAFELVAAGSGEVTLLLCDVDNLKRLNDLRGHHGGDWALKAVATHAARRGRDASAARSCAG